MSFIQKRTSAEPEPSTPWPELGLGGAEAPAHGDTLNLSEKRTAIAVAGVGAGIVLGALLLRSRNQGQAKSTSTTTGVTGSTGSLSSGGSSAGGSAGTKVTATISPQSITPGSQTILSVNVTGGQPGTALQITSNTGMGDINIDLAGSIRESKKIQLNVPASIATGQYTVQVYVLQGQVLLANTQLTLTIVSAIAAVSPTTPGEGGSLPAPSGLTPAFTMASWGDSVHLAWKAPAGTRWVRFEVKAGVSEVQGQVLPSLVQVLSSVNSVDVPTPSLGGGNYLLLPGVQYNWNVSASASATKPSEDDLGSFGPPVRSSFTTPAPTTTLSPIAPTGTTQEPRPLFRWSDNNSHQFMYQIEISTSPNFSTSSLYMLNIHADAPDRPGPISSFMPNQDMPQGTIYWHVRPLSGKAWGATWQFMEGSGAGTSAGPAPTPAPVIVPSPPPAPPPGASTGAGSATFTRPHWSFASGGTGPGKVVTVESPTTAIAVWGIGTKDSKLDTGTARLFNTIGAGPTGKVNIEDAYVADLYSKGYKLAIVLEMKDATGSTIATGVPGQPGYDTGLIQVVLDTAQAGQLQTIETSMARQMFV